MGCALIGHGLFSYLLSLCNIYREHAARLQDAHWLSMLRAIRAALYARLLKD